MAGRNDTRLIQELKRKEQDLLSLASIEVSPSVTPLSAWILWQGLEDLRTRDQVSGLKQF